MIQPGLIEQEVLHEIAMSIGESLEMDAMLNHAIPIFLRGLGCATAAMLLCGEEEEGGEAGPVFILPRAAQRNQQLNDILARYARQLPQMTLPALLETPASGLYYYAWHLCDQKSGALLLGRSTPIPEALQLEIAPLVYKLGHALKACRQFASLQATQQEMARARDAAQAANRAKSNFLATMSHEIRTPLNAVINLSELLLESELTSRQRELVEGICQGGVSLFQLVNDVLDFSKIEAGKMEIQYSNVELRSLLEGVCNLFEQQATQKGLQFGLSIAPDVPRMLSCDQTRLRQVLQNLLSNAVKFTERGRVHMAVRMTEPNPAGRDLMFQIIDSGIGIRDEEQGKLFEEFHQMDPALNRRFGGSGLGLAIAARLVQMMEGSIGCQSRYGEGSTFWFTLPYQRLSLPATVAHSAVAAQLEGKILLVEDSPTNQMVASALLSKVGCQITVVDNGQDAIAAVTAQPFDLVLMDVSMPGMDGLEATRRIRAIMGPPSAVPIIAMTAHAFAEDKAACLAAGMNDYLTKPLHREQLHAMLARWLQQQGGSPVGEPVPAASEKSLPIIDEQVLAQLANDTSEAVLLKVLDLFLAESKNNLTALEACLVNRDWQQFTKLAHAIKSSAGAMGAKALHQVSSQLEQLSRQGERDKLAALCQELAQIQAQTRLALEAHFQGRMANPPQDKG
ncbi:response regulator [Pseudaeromonas paramecii]|uniref:histidine kinase n=1 Tax=Pseudaeromonas paramecii TaxID=2138166 RepID=A0ABP8PUW7_9GAMM